MIDISKVDYSSFDSPMISASLFYPRTEWGAAADDEAVESIVIPVEKDVVVGARLHMAGDEAATILFFHGNGEIVADYDDLGLVYTDMDINFLPVDYRGYGRSTGQADGHGHNAGLSHGLCLHKKPSYEKGIHRPRHSDGEIPGKRSRPGSGISLQR